MTVDDGDAEGVIRGGYERTNNYFIIETQNPRIRSLAGKHVGACVIIFRGWDDEVVQEADLIDLTLLDVGAAKKFIRH